jgi:hypothetical protein
MQPLAAAFAFAQKKNGGALPPTLRLGWAVDRLLAESAAPAGKHSSSSVQAVATVASVKAFTLDQMVTKRRAIATCQTAFQTANGCPPTAAPAATRLAFALEYFKAQTENSSCSKLVIAEALNLSKRTFSSRTFSALARHRERTHALEPCDLKNTDLTGQRNSTTIGQPRYVNSSSNDLIVHAISSRSVGTTPVLKSELPSLLQMTSNKKAPPSRSTLARFLRDNKQKVRMRRSKAIAVSRATAGQRNPVLEDHFNKLDQVYREYPVCAAGHCHAPLRALSVSHISRFVMVAALPKPLRFCSTSQGAL